MTKGKERRASSVDQGGGSETQPQRGVFVLGVSVCERFEKDRVIGGPRIGCAYWMRAIGSDD